MTSIKRNDIDFAVFYFIWIVGGSRVTGSFVSPGMGEVYQNTILVRAQTLFGCQSGRAVDYYFVLFYFYGFFRKIGFFKRILHFKMVLFIGNASDVALCASVLPSILGFTRFMQFMQFMEIAFSTRSLRSGFFLPSSMYPRSL